MPEAVQTSRTSSTKFHLELRSSIASAGARLESPSLEFGEDSDSQLVENLLASVSQHRRQKNAGQTRNRMRARIMNGYWPFIGCMGYRFARQHRSALGLTAKKHCSDFLP